MGRGKWLKYVAQNTLLFLLYQNLLNVQEKHPRKYGYNATPERDEKVLKLYLIIISSYIEYELLLFRLL